MPSNLPKGWKHPKSVTPARRAAVEGGAHAAGFGMVILVAVLIGMCHEPAPTPPVAVAAAPEPTSFRVTPQSLEFQADLLRDNRAFLERKAMEDAQAEMRAYQKSMREALRPADDNDIPASYRPKNQSIIPLANGRTKTISWDKN